MTSTQSQSTGRTIQNAWVRWFMLAAKLMYLFKQITGCRLQKNPACQSDIEWQVGWSVIRLSDYPDSVYSSDFLVRFSAEPSQLLLDFHGGRRETAFRIIQHAGSEARQVRLLPLTTPERRGQPVSVSSRSLPIQPSKATSPVVPPTQVRPIQPVFPHSICSTSARHSQSTSYKENLICLFLHHSYGTTCKQAQCVCVRSCICHKMYDYIREQTAVARSANLCPHMHIYKIHSPAYFHPNRQCTLP